MGEQESKVFEEYHERAKTYLENALKVLGLGQIAASVGEMFWGGDLHFTVFNVGILITGLIFFFGGDTLQARFRKIVKENDKIKSEELEFDSKRTFDPSTETSLEHFKEVERDQFYKRYGFLKRDDEDTINKVNEK